METGDTVERLKKHVLGHNHQRCGKKRTTIMHKLGNNVCSGCEAASGAENTAQIGKYHSIQDRNVIKSVKLKEFKADLRLKPETTLRNKLLF